MLKSLRSIIFPPLIIWFLSRLLIVLVAMIIVPIAAQNQTVAQLILPGISIPIDPPYDQYGWWDRFFAWDSIWYYRIVHSGYEYADDTRQHSVAFFPLYPLLTWLGMRIGFSFPIAALLVNNLAFLAALIVLYHWVQERYNSKIAWWAIAFMAWCPYSLYCTVIYTEGLFLLLTTASLRAFDRCNYIATAIFGSLATATRITGVALIPAMFITSFRQKRPPKAYLAAIFTGMGLVTYCIYQYILFREPLAFLRAQRGWRTSAGFAWQGWRFMFQQVFLGVDNLASGNLQNIVHPLLMLIIFFACILLWCIRSRINSHLLTYTFAVIWMVTWVLTRNPFPGSIFTRDPSVKLTLIFGGLIVLLITRPRLPMIAFAYAMFSYAIILNTGLTASVERYVYGIATIPVAFSLLLVRTPRGGYFVLGFCGLLLTIFTVQFALNQWLA
ncbi:hypothetical protein [Calothrix sp. NIES-3974]|uniref:hypothetical protein n=1 Tax=Calothrix sp. NIES-3974 TaxID=2005462 RepID=UPI000B5DEF39|nr:hypothetical protein [Calothrix sp. NIES-3974]BAZ06741.1 hypothetical protein NIES3974_34030 [Calothrix sp. NIES-3974]